MTTIINLHCNSCNSNIGQFTTTEDIKDEIKCPVCGSEDVTIGTVL